MSGRIVREILENAPQDLTPGQLLVLIALAEDAHDTNRLARWSDVGTLSLLTRLRPGTIRNALAELASRALIKPTITVVTRKRHQVWFVCELDTHHREATRR